MTGSAARASPADRVAAAVRDAEVGAETLYLGLADLGGLEVDVAGDTATVTVTLPVPHAGTRAAIEAGIGSAATDVAGVSTVDVDWAAEPADSGERIDLLPDVKHVVAVGSAKGGVGKSTVAANLAASLADAGAAVGLLDADVYGPNAPAMLGLDARTPGATDADRMVPREAQGVRVMSMGFIAGEDDPVIWRGPLVDDLLKQLFGDVEWGELDYLVVDLPPGTGDAQLSLVQHLPVAGAVVVTTPGTVAVDDARRGLVGFSRYDVPVLGVVENMTSFACPDCGHEHALFGSGGGDELEDDYDIPVLGEVPLDPDVGTLSTEREASGVSLPLVGRVGLPRTREERGPARLPPVARREAEGEAGRALRLAATRTAARLNQLAVGGAPT